MTSHADEIRNLRDRLDHIRQVCSHELAYGNPTDEARRAWSDIRDIAVRALKTPRASVLLPTGGDTDVFP